MKRKPTKRPGKTRPMAARTVAHARQATAQRQKATTNKMGQSWNCAACGANGQQRSDAIEYSGKLLCVSCAIGAAYQDERPERLSMARAAIAETIEHAEHDPAANWRESRDLYRIACGIVGFLSRTLKTCPEALHRVAPFVSRWPVCVNASGSLEDKELVDVLRQRVMLGAAVPPEPRGGYSRLTRNMIDLFYGDGLTVQDKGRTRRYVYVRELPETRRDLAEAYLRFVQSLDVGQQKQVLPVKCVFGYKGTLQRAQAEQKIMSVASAIKVPFLQD